MLLLRVFPKLDLRLCGALALLMLLAGNCSAEICRWQDSRGQSHFSDLHYSRANPLANCAEDLGLAAVRTQSSGSINSPISIVSHDSGLLEEEMLHFSTEAGRVFDYFSEVLRVDVARRSGVEVHLFSGPADYYQYLEMMGASGTAPTRGYYLSGANQVALYVRKDLATTLKTLRHEVAHALLHSGFPTVPVWLEEGLAEQMETLQLLSGELVVGRHGENQNIVNHHYLNDTLPRLSVLWPLTSAQWGQAHQSLPIQSLSGELLGVLLSAKEGRKQVAGLLRLGAESVTGDVQEQFEFRWRDYLSLSLAGVTLN